VSLQRKANLDSLIHRLWMVSGVHDRAQRFLLTSSDDIVKWFAGEYGLLVV
jgi:hypothetical protein